MPDPQPIEDYVELCWAADSDDSEVSAVAFDSIERLTHVRADQLGVLTDLTTGRTNSDRLATETMRLAATRILGKAGPHQITGTQVFATIVDRLQSEPSSIVREALIQTAANLWPGADPKNQREVIDCLERIRADSGSGLRSPKELRLAKLALERFRTAPVAKDSEVSGIGIPKQNASFFGEAGERIG
jgi:hypothetical protein